MIRHNLLEGILTVALLSELANGHGRLIDPPSRSSLWRFKEEFKLIRESSKFGEIQTNNNDNQLFCGGSQTQLKNDGKCGVCGDNYADPQPRENEAGGKYGLGIISRQYRTGSSIDVSVEITAQHKGYFEFRLCKWNNPNQVVTQECLDENLLEIDRGTTRYEGIDKSQTYVVKVQLPEGLTCSQCVLQWKYKTGNSWGCEKEKCGLGYGHQEHFYGCADIAIGDDFGEESAAQESSTMPTPSSAPETTSRSWRTTTTTGRTTPQTTLSAVASEIPPRPGPTLEDCEDKTFGIYYKWDCQRFYTCLHGYSNPLVQSCAPGTAFNGIYCDYSNRVPGCE